MRLLLTSLVRGGHDAHYVRIHHTLSGQCELFPAAASVRDGAQLRTPDAWYISILYPRQYIYLPALFGALHIPILSSDRHPGYPLVVVGGQAMIAPEPIADIADIVCLGDGEVTGPYVASLLSQATPRRSILDALAARDGYYVPTRQHPPHLVRRRELGSTIPTEVLSVGTGRKRETIEVARGCRYRCAYCSVGWAGGTYREADPEVVVRAIHNRHGSRINLYAPSYTSVSHAARYEQAVAAAGCRSSGLDSRVDEILRWLADGLPPRDCSLGIEGVSERLRRRVGKPVTDSDLIRLMGLLDGKVRVVKWYIIPGLPSETADDRAEFDAILDQLRSLYTRSRLEISPTLFQPVPHTPLAWADGTWPSRSYDWAVGVRRRFAHDDRGVAATRWMCGPPKGRELHEHDVYLQRADRWLARYLVALDGRSRMIPSGRWRGLIARLGLPCVADVVGPLDPTAVHPWSHIDVGSPPGAALRAYEVFLRETSTSTPASPQNSSSSRPEQSIR